jgi:UDP-N-acetylglucosamine--N-acetylmuramyl-(pentapeptide) pyrophosphoryl-undecaprenol N-acetylglucosamine transferase
MSKTIAFCCGGTGGHVYPAIAVASALPSEITSYFLVSSDREDRHIVDTYGFSRVILGPYKLSPFRILTPLARCIKTFLTQRPDALICTGGAQTIWAGLAAKLLGIPLIVMEQNSLAGRTNRLLSLFADAIYLTWEESRSGFFRQSICEVTGNPVRSSFPRDPYLESALEQPMHPGPVVLVFGGSQGAHALNDLIRTHVDFWLDSPYTVILLTGKSYYRKHYTDPNVTAHFKDEALKLLILPYSEAMDILYKKADVVVSRSGATTLAELIAFHKKAVLIPFPFSKDYHQDHNARLFCEQYAGDYFLQNELSCHRLDSAIRQLMESNASFSGVDSAREKVVRLILDRLSLKC